MLRDIIKKVMRDKNITGNRNNVTTVTIINNTPFDIYYSFCNEFVFKVDSRV